MNSIPSPLPFLTLVFLLPSFSCKEQIVEFYFRLFCWQKCASYIYSAGFALPFLCHRLLSAVLRTSEVESRATRASLTELLSPQMGKDIVWFLRRWAKTYLLVDEKLYGQVSCQNEVDQCVETAGTMSE